MKKRKRLFNSIENRLTLTALQFIAPAFLLYSILILVPVLNTVYLSFFEWNGLDPIKDFVGLQNYIQAFQDKYFLKSFINNIIWVVLLISIPLVISLLLGIAVTNDKIKGRDQFQAIFFIPYILSPVVIALIWKVLYSPNIGVLNYLLQKFHMVEKPFGILGDQQWALYGLIFVHVWNLFGFCTVIYINGLQSIDPELYDAAKIDGANAFQKMIYVTLPGVSTVTTLLVLLMMINAFKTFNFVFLMTTGGPFQSTEVVAYRIYIEAFQLHKFGYGSTLAVILSFVIVIIGMYYVSLRERKMENN
jgi:ABC-type sugar transport system permease subunit